MLALGGLGGFRFGGIFVIYGFAGGSLESRGRIVGVEFNFDRCGVGGFADPSGPGLGQLSFGTLVGHTVRNLVAGDESDDFEVVVLGSDEVSDGGLGFEDF